MTRIQLESWLIGRERSHLVVCGWSTVGNGDNADLNGAIYDSIRRVRIQLAIADPDSVTSDEIESVPDYLGDRLRAAARFYLLERVLSHYRSQANQETQQGRIELGKRADGLAADLYGKDGKGGLKADLDELLVSILGGPVQVGERLKYTNIPDASCVPRRY